MPAPARFSADERAMGIRKAYDPAPGHAFSRADTRGAAVTACFAYGAAVVVLARTTFATITSAE
jgi:hypothetical protein